jgi:hypothetical protein
MKKKKLFNTGDKIFVPATVVKEEGDTGKVWIRLLYDVVEDPDIEIQNKTAKKCITR